MAKGKLLYIGVLLYLIAVFLFYTTGVGEMDSGELIVELIFILSPLFAVIMGVLAIKKYTLKSVYGKTFLFLTLGMLCWLIGEAIWIYFFLTDIGAFPSIADVFYLLAYPLLLIGILHELKDGGLNFKWDGITIGITLLMLVLVAVTGYYGVYWAYDEEATGTENAVAMSYGIGDIILLVMVGLLIIKYGAAFFAKSWMLLGSGIILTWGGDILYAMFYEAYEEGLWLATQMDYLWIVGYLLMGFFFYRQMKAIDEVAAEPAP